MHWFSTIPIRRKLTFSILLASTLASLLACATFGVYDWVTYRQAMCRDLVTLGGVLANNSTAALSFKVESTATELLHGLRVHPHIEVGSLYDQDGDLFAFFTRPGSGNAIPSTVQPDGARFFSQSLILFQPVELDGRRIGTIYLQSDLRALSARLRLYASIVAMVLGIGLVATLLLSPLLQRPITRPILSLAETAQRIANHRDYTLRVEKASMDEVGQLTESFNTMIAGIESRDSALRDANATLKAEIAVRRKAEADLRLLNETLEQRVSERTAVAEQANRAKSEFLANMSHELRTPLNSVIGFANLLIRNKAGNLSHEDVTFLERIQANGRHLLSLINQILDLSKIEAGRADLQIAPLDVAALIKSLTDEFEGQLQGRNVRFVVEIPDPVAPFDTDADKLKQILINLVGNAVKFTEHGSVTVRVTVNPSTRRPQSIDVIDTGIGIPPDKLSVIFDAFRQADNTTARRFGGTGLGLAISKTLSRLLGYRIEVASKPGVGSTFRVLLSSCPTENQVTPDASEAKAMRHAEPDRRLVLVIDDENDARVLLARMIEEFGYQVTTAPSGEEGIRLARSERPDAITLDLLMPGMDGWTVLRRLKDDPALASIPVIVVSIVAAENRGSVFGAVDLLQKPISRDEVARVLQLCNRPRVLVVEDNAEDRRIFASILEKEAVETQMVSNGREALVILRNFKPDVILLDLSMPEMDGLAFLQVVDREFHGKVPPVVIVTSTAPDESVRSYLNQWATSIISKQDELPVRLRHALDSILRRDSRTG